MVFGFNGNLKTDHYFSEYIIKETMCPPSSHSYTWQIRMNRKTFNKLNKKHNRTGH